MSASASLSLAEWTVLALISEAPTHGFAIYRLTAPDGELGRIWHIHRPVVYRSIGRLEEAGLVAPQTVEPGRGPQRMIYAATPGGHKVAAAWLDTPVEHIRDVRSHLLIKLALLDRAGTDPTRLLRRQKAILEPIASAIAKEQPERQGFDATLLAWRRATAAAALSFLDAITQLRTAWGAGVVSAATFLGRPPAGLPPCPALGRGGPPGGRLPNPYPVPGVPALGDDRVALPADGRLAGLVGGHHHVGCLDHGSDVAAFGQAELPDGLDGDGSYEADPVGVEFDISDGLTGVDAGNAGRDLIACADRHDVLLLWVFTAGRP